MTIQSKRPPIEEFSGHPDILRQLLEEEASERRGVWARRRLVNWHGIVVSLRVTAKSGQRAMQLAIARDAAPTTLFEKSRWEADVRQLQRLLGAAGWRRGDDVYDGDAVAAIFGTR